MSASPKPERSSADPATSQVPLIGRAAELELLAAELRRALAGRFRVCLIEGPAGVGKTRLMREVMASAAGFPTVISARSYRLGATTSFGPWLEALDRYALRHDHAEIRRLLGVEDERAPTRDLLLERMTSLFDDFSAEAPVLVTIDDVHLADDSSWEALRFIARRLHDRPIGVMLTARSGGLSGNSLAKDVLMALDDDGVLRRISVRPLNAGEVAELVEARLRSVWEESPSGGVPASLIEWIRQRSLGHPLFALSLVDALVEEGADLADPTLTTVPSSLRDRVGAELSLLPDDAHRVIEVMAVLDREAGPVEIAEVLERDLGDIVTPLDILTGKRLITENQGRAGVVYEITHPLIQEAVYETIGGAKRMALHRAVARVLLAHDRWGAAAAHYARSSAGADDESLGALCRAIEEAESRGLYREALAILAGLPQLIEPGDPRWLRVLESITWQADWVVDHLAEGDAIGAVEVMRRIEEVVRRDSDPVALGIVHFHLASFLAIGVGRLDHAEAACRRALEMFRRVGERQRELLALNELVWISSCAGELDRAIDIAGSILDRAGTGDERVVNQAAGAKAYALGLMGRFEESQSHYELADRMAETHHMTYRRVWGLVQQSQAWSLSGHLGRAEACVEQALGIDYSMACDALALERRAHIRWLQGDLETCVGLIDESGARRAVRDSRRRAWGLALAARALVDLGRGSQARRYLDQSGETYTGDDILDWSAWRHWTAGYLAFVDGEHTRAVELLHTAAERYRNMGALSVEGLVLVDLGELAVSDTDGTLAADTAARLGNIAQRTGGHLHADLAEMVEAMSTGSQERESGSRLVAVSRRLSDRGYRGLGQTAAHWAGVALEGSDADTAREALTKAARLAADSGAVWRRDRSLRWLSRLGAKGRRAVGSILGPESLTRREREVAELAARGYTARQIADRMYIGTRTVESHLAHIYPKLGIESKRELVQRAAELGLREPSAQGSP